MMHVKHIIQWFLATTTIHFKTFYHFTKKPISINSHSHFPPYSPKQLPICLHQSAGYFM